MPRKSDNILEILTTLPWWVSVIVAAFVYAAMAFLVLAITGDSVLASGLVQMSVQLAPFGLLLFLLPVPFSLFNSTPGVNENSSMPSRISIPSVIFPGDALKSLWGRRTGGSANVLSKMTAPGRTVELIW